ncbi:MAG: bifunctional diaminohydroxyphosphoribosylaminopyrimidine deaminase/5-amino-6-(5-phosphoribosylamino)uracil reductase RibD [Patescibacteria group bacterium]
MSERDVKKDEKYMSICLRLAEKGLGNVAPNPMVGSVIVFDKKIIGKGYHQKYGEAHAEVNAVKSVKNKKLLEKSTLYVNLEPCAHFGKTPPCTDLIIKHKIPNVVIGCLDTFAKVNGQGIEKLLKAGIKVKIGVLEKESRDLNKTFFTYQEKKRPYVILKWAQTANGFMDAKRTFGDGKKPLQISNKKSKILSHKMRSENQAIIVGTNTALLDNPELTVRLTKGKNPIRIAIDQYLKIPKNFHLLDKKTPTLIFAEKKKNPKENKKNLEYIKINFKKNILPQILKELYARKIQSLIVEGGATLLNSFIKNNLWDEIKNFVSKKKLKEKGIKAPVLKFKKQDMLNIDSDKLFTYTN